MRVSNLFFVFIEWQVNGKPISCGSRILVGSDFGLVSLDIQCVQMSDAGVITCTATNKSGKATTSGTLKVNPAGNIISSTQHPAGQSGLDNINKMDSLAFNLPDDDNEAIKAASEKPLFTTQLPEKTTVLSGLLHLECNVEPKHDPKLAINWFHNGLPLSSATRIKANLDFGLVTLDIQDMNERDSGVYTCKAVNEAGEAVVFTTVSCDDDANIDLETKHPKGKQGLQAISDFESKLQDNIPMDEGDSGKTGEAPAFTQGFTDAAVTEGDKAYFEAKLEPKNDSDMTLSWEFNGKPLLESSRYKKVFSFGMVILEIGNVSSTDAGTYVCTASNKFGSAKASVTLNFVEEKSSHCPKFVGKLEDQLNLKDGESVHFQCALEPVNDSDLKVEWLFNGENLPNSFRIKTVADFGFVMLDIAGVDSRDSGTYTCRAWNK